MLSRGLPLLALSLLLPCCSDDSSTSGGAGGQGGSTSGSAGAAGSGKAGSAGSTGGSAGSPAAGAGGSSAGASGSPAGMGGSPAGAGGSPAGAGGSSAGAGGSPAGAGGSPAGGSPASGAGGAAAGSPAAGGAGGAEAGGGGSPPAGAAGTGGAGQAGAAGQGGECAVDGTTHTGEGTFYAATGAGNCSFPESPEDLMVGAMNQADYQGSAACGACARVKGPQGEVTVRIVDRCPECKPGDIDLSPQAFEKLAPLDDGRIPITWSYVACAVQGPIVYHFKEGSNQWWTAVQIRNHRYPIATLEYKGSDGQFKPVERLDYNYFVEPAGMGPGPYTFRVTDTLGHKIESANIPFKEADDAPGSDQFPACGAP